MYRIREARKAGMSVGGGPPPLRRRLRSNGLMTHELRRYHYLRIRRRFINPEPESARPLRQSVRQAKAAALVAEMGSLPHGLDLPCLFADYKPTTAFLFPDQVSQTVEMGAEA